MDFIIDLFHKPGLTSSLLILCMTAFFRVDMGLRFFSQCSKKTAQLSI